MSLLLRRSPGKFPAALIATALAGLLTAPAALALPSCGDGTGSAGIAASDALLTLKKAVGQAVTCLPCACDVNADSAVTAGDALAILKRAVGSLRYLSCVAASGCTDPSPKLDAIVDQTLAPAALADALGGGFIPAPGAPTWIRFFGGSLSIEVPAVISETGRIAAAAPPLAPGVVAPAGGFRVQVVQGLASPAIASNVVAGLSIDAAPVAPTPPGTVTADFLFHMITRAGELLQSLPTASAVADAISQTRTAMQTLRAGVVALRDHTTDSFSLGALGGQPLMLTRADLAQSDSMILATLLAQSQVPASAALTAAFTPADGAPLEAPDAQAAAQAAPGTDRYDLASDCRQPEALAYYTSQINGTSTTNTGIGYASSTCIASAAKTGFAVGLGSAALGAGVISLVGGAAVGVGLAKSAAATLYISIVGSSGLAAVGSALKDTSHDAVALVKQGVAQAESTMQGLVTGFVLPNLTGTILDMTNAVRDLSEAFADFTPSPTTTTSTSTTSTTSSSSTSTAAPAACYCCCAFWDGCPPCTNFYCRELPSPESPPDSEAACTAYNQDFCDSNYCEQ